MYSVEREAKAEHIDFQGIMDGLYYPHYMEEIRHNYMKEVHAIDIVEAAKEGKNYVLVSYEMRFKKPIHKGDLMQVTCELKPINVLKFGFNQKILVNDTICAEADFVVTCVPAGGGRPALPEELKKVLNQLSNE